MDYIPLQNYFPSHLFNNLLPLKNCFAQKYIAQKSHRKLYTNTRARAHSITGNDTLIN